MKAQIPEKKISKAEPIRPFCLEYADAKNEVFAAVNGAMQKHNVPLFLMENILSEATVSPEPKVTSVSLSQSAKTNAPSSADGSSIAIPVGITAFSPPSRVIGSSMQA